MEGEEPSKDRPATAQDEEGEKAEEDVKVETPRLPLTEEEKEFEEFLAQVSFKRTTDINGYSEEKIQFVFVPYKLTSVHQEFTIFFENQDYTEPIPFSITGECVDVPIYVA